MAVMLFMSTSVFALVDCMSYAKKSMRAEFMAYGFDSQEEVDEAISWYFNACNEAGGDIDNPVFL